MTDPHKEVAESSTDNIPEKFSEVSGVYWWAMLLVAILAVPSIGFIIAYALPIGELGQLVAFVITCWVSTWVGMWLMKKTGK